jgi:hypothetical protein
VSQSIKSDRISESTIARIAGNLLSGTPREWQQARQRETTVAAAVATARLIAAEVERTAAKCGIGFHETELAIEQAEAPRENPVP